MKWMSILKIAVVAVLAIAVAVRTDAIRNALFPSIPPPPR